MKYVHKYLQTGLSIFLPIILVYLFVFCNFKCSKKVKPDQIVLAKVGKEIMTMKDFRYNYEFGLSQLKRGSDPKKSCLD